MLARFFRVTVKAIGKNKKGRCPKSNKDAESLCMRLRVGWRSACQKPDSDWTDDWNKAKDEAERTDKFNLWLIHIFNDPTFER